jgi:High-temperature-induced dauer-formation protein
LKATLLETPGIEILTEKKSAHPSPQLLNEIASAEKPSTSITDITNGETDISIEEKSSTTPVKSPAPFKRAINTRGSIRVTQNPTPAQTIWRPNTEWVQSWRAKLPLQTIMRLLQVLVPQVEKICIDKYEICINMFMKIA